MGKQLADLGAPALVAHLRELTVKRSMVSDRGVGERDELSSAELGTNVGMMSQQDLAQRGGVGGQQGADIEGLQRVVRTEDVVNDEDLGIVQRGDPNCFLRASRQ